VSAEGGTHTSRRRRPRSPWVATVVIIAILIAVAVLLWIPVAATSTSSYCSSCKATEAAGASWEQSVHAKVECVECHIPPGFGEQLKWRTREWLNIWADYMNVPRVDQEGQRPGNENCTPCHDMSTIGDEHSTVRLPHQRHTEISGLVCADCHDKVSHGARDEAGDVSMAVCGMCHDESGDPAACEFCHLEPQNVEDTHPDDYIETHGEEARADDGASCLRCHHDAEAFCDECHARPTADHFSGTWKYTHRTVAEQDREGCLGCHDEDTFCEQCHRVSHPDDWIESHGPVAGEGGGSCLTCHPQSMCDRCHEGSR
jgi:nitrate/TMAO reductase-like tetraheme cytochrome c subunit